MAIFRRNLIVIEARQLSGTATDTMDVIDWVRNRGSLPWLIGNANEPGDLAPENGKPGDSGVYLDPANGDFVIHTVEKDMRASYGDWILCSDDGIFTVMSPADFEATYDPA